MIGACGWLGLLVFVLWPIAFLWGPQNTEKAPPRLLPEVDLDALATELRETSEQIAALDARMRVQPSKRIA